MSSLTLNDERSDRGSLSSISSLKTIMTPLIKIKGKNRIGNDCEVQKKITESVEKNLCRRVRLGQVSINTGFNSIHILFIFRVSCSTCNGSDSRNTPKPRKVLNKRI